MPDSEWNATLAAAASEVLETMFFTQVQGPAPSGAPASAAPVAARLAFEGSPSGVLTLAIAQPPARVLAANFLAADEDAPLPESQLGFVVCELANMICGTLLSRIKTEEQFSLSSPELLADSASPLGSPNQSLLVGEGESEGVLDLWLSLENDAG